MNILERIREIGKENELNSIIEKWLPSDYQRESMKKAIEKSVSGFDFAVAFVEFTKRYKAPARLYGSIVDFLKTMNLLDNKPRRREVAGGETTPKTTKSKTPKVHEDPVTGTVYEFNFENEVLWIMEDKFTSIPVTLKVILDNGVNVSGQDIMKAIDKFRNSEAFVVDEDRSSNPVKYRIRRVAEWWEKTGFECNYKEPPPSKRTPGKLNGAEQNEAGQPEAATV